MREGAGEPDELGNVLRGNKGGGDGTHQRRGQEA